MSQIKMSELNNLFKKLKERIRQEHTGIKPRQIVMRYNKFLESYEEKEVYGIMVIDEGKLSRLLTKILRIVYEEPVHLDFLAITKKTIYVQYYSDIDGIIECGYEKLSTILNKFKKKFPEIHEKEKEKLIEELKDYLESV